MKMFSFAVYEFRYLFRSFQTAVIFAIFFGVTFLAGAQGEVLFGSGGGNVHLNAPYQIMKTLIVLSIFVIFISPAFVASAVLRDTDCRFDGILFSMPISRKNYLFGRFLGSFAAMMVAFAGAPIGLLLGTLFSSADPELLGPTNIGHYLTVYFGFIMPSMLTLGALIFAVAVVSRRIIYAYLTAFGLWVVYSVGSEIDFISPIFDPFMFQIFEEQTKYWTAEERNTNLLNFDGIVLINRFIWLGVTATVLTFSYRLFSFRTPAKMRKVRNGHLATFDAMPKADVHVGLRGTPVWTWSTSYRQFLFRTKFEVMLVLTSLPFIILMSFSSLLLIFKLIGNDLNYGVSAYPITRLMIQDLKEVLSMALMGILFFYSADIVWRERQHRFNEIIDALPAPNWVFVVSKIVTLAFVMTSILILGIGIAILIQILNDYHHFEMGLYLERGFFYLIVPFIYLAVLGCFFQVIVKNRFLGMMLFGLYMAYVTASLLLGFEHPILRYGLGGFAAPLSDMNSDSRLAIAGYWIRVYWGSIAGMLLLLTYALWNRGTLQPLKYRLRNLRTFKSKGFAMPALVLLTLFVSSGSYIFYNTNVLNKYRTASDIEQLRLAYEQQYRQFENLPMPRIIDVKIDVDIYPYRRRVEARSTQILQNKTVQKIHTVHLIFPIDSEVPLVELQGAVQKSVNADLAYYIFDLETPMLPGEKRTLKFETIIQQQGFVHARPDIKLVRNGTFIGSNHLTPDIGFNTGMLISDRNKRRDYGLEPLPRLPKLEDTSSYSDNYVSQDSDFIAFETTVSTVASQIAISPGYLVKEWVEGERRYFAYKMDVPIMNFYSYLSADYEVASDKWNGVDIEVFHHAPHTYNVDRMIASVKDSLSYYSKAFGPYQYRQLRILEFPAYRTFARAYPNTIPYSEGIGFVADVRDPNEIDLPYYVTAHEVAHQWWAHQVMAANVQGGTMLTETLAQYSALLVMEQKYGKYKLRKFLKLELERYLSGRAGDAEGELPLYKVEGQSYIRYRKGSVIMYALKDYVGEDVVNCALRRLIELRAFNSMPYAISTDFLDILKEEAGSEHLGLIEDFFEKITVYDVKLNDAKVVELVDGRFKVLLNVEVAKFYADSEGNETEANFDIPVEIGLFQRSPVDGEFGASDVIMLEKRRITGDNSSLEIIVDKKPMFAGIDPYNKLIDRNSDDNLGEVK